MVAFAQNTRNEVRLVGGDGSLAGAIASNPSTTKGQGASLVCMASAHTNAEVGEDMSPALIAHIAKDASIVVDRAAFNQGGGCGVRAPHRADGADGHHCGEGAARYELSNGQQIVGPLCARDWKGVGSEYVDEGKVVAVRRGSARG